MEKVKNTLIGIVAGANSGATICLLLFIFSFTSCNVFFVITNWAIIGGFIALFRPGARIGMLLGFALGLSLVVTIASEVKSGWLILFLSLVALSTCTGSGWAIGRMTQ